MTKGDTYEREFLNRMQTHGFAAMRAPSSGSATTDELPDVLVAQRGGPTIAAEIKFRSNASANLPREEVEALESFAIEWGAAPIIAYRLSGDTTWHCYYPLGLNETRHGNFSATPTMVKDGYVGMELADLSGCDDWERALACHVYDPLEDDFQPLSSNNASDEATN